MYSQPLTSGHKFILQKYSEYSAIWLNFRFFFHFILMEMIPDALKFGDLDKLREKWQNSTTYDTLQRFTLQTDSFFSKV